MSAVIEFPRERVRRVEETQRVSPAEVIIFPGVRVERLAFDLAERLTPGRAGTAGKASNSDLDFY